MDTMGLGNSAMHFSALLDALGGTGIGWDFNGTVIDYGKPIASCACGHVIRFGFMLSKPGCKDVQVGSTCVEHAPGLDPSVLTRITDALGVKMAEHRERERKAKELAKDAEIAAQREAIGERARPFLAAFRQHREERRWMPDDVYHNGTTAAWAIRHAGASLKARAAILRRCGDARRALDRLEGRVDA